VTSCFLHNYVIVYIRKVKSCVQIADRCAPWKISSGTQNFDSSASKLTLLPADHRLTSELSSESELLHNWWFTASLFVLVTSPLRLTTSNIFQLNTCGHSAYVTSSLTRGWVCRLQLLLALEQPFSGSSLTELITTFYCLRFETPSTWRARSLYLYTPGIGGPVIPPGTGFPFRHLLRLKGLQWRHLTPPPRRLGLRSKSK
jgi:hypothetical protein